MFIGYWGYSMGGGSAKSEILGKNLRFQGRILDFSDVYWLLGYGGASAKSQILYRDMCISQILRICGEKNWRCARFTLYPRRPYFYLYPAIDIKKICAAHAFTTLSIICHILMYFFIIIITNVKSICLITNMFISARQINMFPDINLTSIKILKSSH